MLITVFCKKKKIIEKFILNLYFIVLEFKFSIIFSNAETKNVNKHRKFSNYYYSNVDTYGII